jgi:uncharacterized protein (TIGR00297 family)
MTTIVEAGIVFAILVFFSIVSFKKKALDFEGVMIANIVGLAIFLRGNIVDFFSIVIFFVLAELCTRYSRAFQKKKHEIRTTSNILGNSGAAIIALFLGSQIGFFGAIAAALADTLSSEIGLLSKKKPVLITNFKPVKPGTDGGVTLLGCIAAVFGASVIGIFHFAIFSNINLAIALVVAGFFGSIADSIAGALFERKGGLNNAEVNFLGSASGAIIAVLLAKALGFP